MQRHPAADADADRGDLVLGNRAVRKRRPVVRATQTPTRSSRRSPVDAETAERGDDPGFKCRHIASNVRRARIQVEHRIGDPLAGPVIGELAAAAGAMNGKAPGVEEVGVTRARAGGVERRMLQEPHAFARLAGGNCGGSRLHLRHGFGIGHQPLAEPPFDRRAVPPKQGTRKPIAQPCGRLGAGGRHGVGHGAFLAPNGRPVRWSVRRVPAIRNPAFALLSPMPFAKHRPPVLRLWFKRSWRNW